MFFFPASSNSARSAGILSSGSVGYSCYNEYFFQNIKDGKRIWKGIKQIAKFKPQTSQRLMKIVDNNLEITEPKLVANAFNNYFANIG